MPTTAGELSRVLNALEDLASQEELLINTEDYSELAAVQECMNPLVRFLVEGVNVADAPLQERIAALVMRRERAQQRLVSEMDKVREEIAQIDASRRRIAQVAPAYGLRRNAPTAPRLSARS